MQTFSNAVQLASEAVVLICLAELPGPDLLTLTCVLTIETRRFHSYESHHLHHTSSESAIDQTVSIRSHLRNSVFAATIMSLSFHRHHHLHNPIIAALLFLIYRLFIADANQIVSVIA